ncbi:cytochrome c peroxidase [Pontibacter sp. G13]|uniref:cytochrome c peroxidase n=1 Tax=Pontibacter sp. G13 TaxID=3074898 RepID=UPI00288BCEC4|nr:cytochrome c peroxidase [Pontibacter sp. G13]WNJ18148.1 cytochrome c peroxidase [Pontibacter sp. G13]
MKKSLLVCALIVATLVLKSGTIDLDNLFNYANQAIPSYITKDNTPAHNPITDEGATLGRVLFYDKKLSIDNTVSCSNCHIQEYAFSDTNNVSIGINGNLTPRHSMRLVNARFGAEEKFRWDETAANLEDQMIIPIKQEAEMGYSGQNGMPSFADLISKLDSTDYYPQLFTLAFGDAMITEERMARALAQFVRSIQSFDSKYDIGRAQVADDLTDFPNFTSDENDGKRLFIQDFQWVEDTITVGDVPGDPGGTFDVAKRISGGFNCATCHMPPEFDIDPNSLNNAFVRPASNHPNEPSWLDGTRSPTLRDLIQADGVTLNGGMFHSGQAHFLQDIFGHYEFRRLDTVDNTNLDPRLTKISPTTGRRIGLLMNSNPNERQKINAFLSTLTGTDVYTNEKWADPFDANGQLTLTGAGVSIDGELEDQFAFTISPNPVVDQLTLSGKLDRCTLMIYNTRGQQIRQVALRGSSQTIDLSALKAGVYIATLQDANHRPMGTQKFIKE